MVSVRKITINFLENQAVGEKFSPTDIAVIVNNLSGGHRFPYRDTIGRYIREWRSMGHEVVCISREKSLYQIREK